MVTEWGQKFVRYLDENILELSLNDIAGLSMSWVNLIYEVL